MAKLSNLTDNEAKKSQESCTLHQFNRWKRPKRRLLDPSNTRILEPETGLPAQSNHAERKEADYKMQRIIILFNKQQRICRIAVKYLLLHPL